jgi:hypothetical protein
MEDLRGFVLDKLRSTFQRRDSWLIEGPRIAKQTWFGESLLCAKTLPVIGAGSGGRRFLIVGSLRTGRVA